MSKSPYNHDVNNPNEAARFDEGKDRMELAPVSAMRALAKVFGMGAGKYGDFNWQKGFPWLQPYASAMRHMAAWWEGEDLDAESGLPHIYHALANLAMLVEFHDKGRGTDNRLCHQEQEWLKRRDGGE